MTRPFAPETQNGTGGCDFRRGFELIEAVRLPVRNSSCLPFRVNRRLRPAFRTTGKKRAVRVRRGAEIIAAGLTAADQGKTASLSSSTDQQGDRSQRPRPGGEGDQPERGGDTAGMVFPVLIVAVCEVPAQRTPAGGPGSLMPRFGI